jgi:2-iminobutanoate/2-iminopropanoate deaminase
MSIPIAISTDKAPKAIAPYSRAILADGVVYCSGQIPIDPTTGQTVGGGIEDQTRRVMDNLAAVLAAAGTDLGHAVKTTVFLVDLAEFERMNAVYVSYFRDWPGYFEGGGAPARSTVEVRRLPRDARVEIDCIAVLP